MIICEGMRQLGFASSPRRRVLGSMGVVLIAGSCNAISGISDLSFGGHEDAGGAGGNGGAGGGGASDAPGTGGSAGLSQPGSVRWAIELDADDYGPDVRSLRLANDKVFACGAFDGTVDFGVGGPVTSKPTDDAYVLALDAASGTASWRRVFFGAQLQGCSDLAVMGGAIHVFGDYRFEIDLGVVPGQTSPIKLTTGGSDKVYLAALTDDATGSTASATDVPGTSTELAGAIAIDGAENLYLYGSYRGSPDFGGGPLPSPPALDGAATDNAFVVKLSPTGSQSYALPLENFARNFGGESFFGDIAVDAAGNAYVAGSFRDSFIAQKAPSGPILVNLVGPGSVDAFLLRVAPDGTPVWAAPVLGGNGDQLTFGVAIDSGSNAIWAGTIQGTVDLGGPWVSKGNDAFIAKYASDGTLSWKKIYSDPTEPPGLQSAQNVRAVAVDPADNIFVIGDFENSIELGEAAVSPLQSAGGADVFVVKYSPTGTLLWAERLGGENSERASTIAVDATQLVVAGTFFGSLTLGDDTLSTLLGDGGTSPARFIASLAP